MWDVVSSVVLQSKDSNIHVTDKGPPQGRKNRK